MKKFSNNFDKVYIIPKILTSVEHRSECVPYYNAVWSEEAGGWSLAGAYLPLFTAPMACVVDDKNYLDFDKEGIQPIIPRTVSLEKRLELSKKMVWVALGLDEFEKFIKDTESIEQETYICVDIANGHMKKLVGLCKTAKQKLGGNLILMAGNIADPNTYEEYAKVGIDYVRICIGSGNGCRTTDVTGVYSGGFRFLINMMYRKRRIAEESDYHSRYKSVPYIVYDGGCNSIRDIIIALALGADYVMCGKLFTQAQEAAGEVIEKQMSITYNKIIPATDGHNTRIIEVEDNCFKPGRMYYGMSTERAQREMGNTKIKQSEGTEYWVPIEYTLHDWVSQFVNSISSTMSYCDVTKLTDFIGQVPYNYD